MPGILLRQSDALRMRHHDRHAALFIAESANAVGRAVRISRVAIGDTAELARIERWALERNAEHTGWICDERRMGLTRDGEALYMHCLPADIGSEVSPAVMERFKVAVAREANWKVYVVMALLAGAKVPSLATALAALDKENSS